MKLRFGVSLRLIHFSHGIRTLILTQLLIIAQQLRNNLSTVADCLQLPKTVSKLNLQQFL